jgi:D-alanyl-D-alanine dipeptidase
MRPAWIALAAFWLTACGISAREEVLTDFHSLAPETILDLRYATANNFLKRRLYPKARCLLRPAVARALATVAEDLRPQGLRLKVFDCYRPLSVQKQLWAILRDERYVADPAKGSRHNRGAAVDVTLTDAAGRELTMPTGFDDFSERAHRDFRELPPERIRNRERLEAVMRRHGFEGLPTEWWHFDYRGWERYSILDRPL